MNKTATFEECRACLHKIKKGKVYNLFEEWFRPWALHGAVIADDLSKFADVEISELDKYSNVICPRCYRRLSDACTFMITVQMSDSILRKRVDDTIPAIASEVETSWPQPILVNKSGNGDLENMLEIEIKQEVMSEEETGANMDQDWEPTMDIKIEPEEISAPVVCNMQMNGVLDKTSDETTNSIKSSSRCEQEEYLNRPIKQEPLSGDELLEAAPDLPLDCMLCFKVFHSVSGLKAHVISQHSYGAVKRKAQSMSPVKSKIQAKEHACNSCDQSFATSTDLMVHRASHSGHVCYVCDRKFNSFQQLTRHGPRCHKAHKTHASSARRDLTRPPPRPQQLSQPIKNTAQKQDKKTEANNTKHKTSPIDDMVANKPQLRVKTWPLVKEMGIESRTQSENEHESEPQIRSVKEIQNCKEATPNKSVVEGPKFISAEARLSAEEIKQEPMKIEIDIIPYTEDIQDLVSEDTKSDSMKEDNKVKPVQNQSESRFSDTKTEEIKLELVQKESPNEHSSENTEVEPTERYEEDSTHESEIESSTIDLRKEISKPFINNFIPYTPLEPTICSIQNTNLDKSTLITADENGLQTDSVPSLPNQDNSNEILSNITCENFEESRIESHDSLTEELEQSIGQKNEQENSSSKKEDDSCPEEKSPLIEKVSEMKVRLAINPLNKDAVLFDTEMAIKDIKSENSDCEPKLVSVISEQSDSQHS